MSPIASAAVPEPELAPFDRDTLAADPSTIYALTPELRISSVNPAWFRFAEANGAVWKESKWSVGAPLMDAIPEVLRPFYRRLFDDALSRREVIEHDYECSSATVLRKFRMRVLPCNSGALLVVHSLLFEAPHDRPAAAPQDERYRQDNGLIAQCSHCRRVRRASEPDWDWVPAYVERMPSNVTHGLCRLCLAYYYPEAEDG